MDRQSDLQADKNRVQAVCCRVCGGDFTPGGLLHLSGMPKAAQNFPKAEDLAEERGEDLELVECERCGLVQLTNVPVTYYRDVIRAAAFSPEMRGYRQQQFADFVARHHLAGQPVIEIGCGQGEFLSLLQEAGAEASGLEHLESSVTACRDAGLSVRQGYPDESGMDIGGPYAGFMILNFFEHLPDPNTALKVIADNLATDGVGLVEVPNFDMILRTNLFSEFINDHLFYFTADTLRTTLNMNGFEVTRCESTWYDYILSAEVRKRASPDTAGLKAAQAQIAADLARCVTKHSHQKVAVWGAGHQSLAVLALTGIADRIDCVVDSAPFKQHRFTPATHRPILPPEAIDERGIGAVIVMAASYSDEVAGLVRERFPQVSCYILRDDGLETIHG